MTQEEKAKAYDRVSKEVKDFFEGRQKMYSDVTQTLEYLFPELKESEDEKIRKGLINYFNDFTLPTFGGLESKKILSWLEKQRKKDEEILVLEDQIESLHAAIKATKNMHKIEQKSIWSEDDEYIIEKLFCLLDNEQDNYPQLSSDFQEIQEIKEWLKSLKNRVGCEANFTTTKEWSEEDKDILNTIINHFEIDLECTENDDIIKWLKSLRPQNHWKPSDEQMKVLKELVEDNNQRYFYTLLKSLYDQLKTLKGE